MNPLHELGLAVRTRRTDMGLTVTAVARMSELSRASVSALENGSIGDLSITRAQRLLNVLGLSLEVPAVHPKPVLNLTARRPALEIAAQTASVSLKRHATPADLQPAFLSDSIPSAFLAHMRLLLEEADVGLLARVADQLHFEKRVPRAKVWSHMRTHAQALQVQRDIFAPEATQKR